MIVTNLISVICRKGFHHTQQRQSKLKSVIEKLEKGTSDGTSTSNIQNVLRNIHINLNHDIEFDTMIK